MGQQPGDNGCMGVAAEFERNPGRRRRRVGEPGCRCRMGESVTAAERVECWLGSVGLLYFYRDMRPLVDLLAFVGNAIHFADNV